MKFVKVVALKMKNPLSDLASRRLNRRCNALIVTSVALLMVFSLFYFGRSLRHLVIINCDVTQLLSRCGIACFVLGVLYFGWVVWLAARRYREFEAPADTDLPAVSVIIPAYNEGERVLAAIDSVLASDYPAGKLEVIAVNDGSSDDTWTWIEQAARRYGNRLRTINLRRNRGKRGAMHAGFTAASGAIWITVDSDSMVFADTLRRLVAPFREPGVGCVAGNVQVWNNRGVLPRVLDVNFVFSFDLMRSAQSASGVVFCAPGALTACRAEVIRPRLDAWAHQTFLGRPANIGEDRALTNIVLAAGSKVTFQQNALVLTRVPENYFDFSKMLIRWARSNVRENIEMLRFAFALRRPSAYSRAALLLHLGMQLIWMLTPVIGVFLFLYCMIATLGSFLLSLLPVLVLAAFFPMLVYRRYRSGDQLLGVLGYALLGFIAMFWVAPYSLFSFHRSGWLTRG